LPAKGRPTAADTVDRSQVLGAREHTRDECKHFPSERSVFELLLFVRDTFAMPASSPSFDQLELFDRPNEGRKSRPRPTTLSKPLCISVNQATARYGVGRTKLYELLGAGALKARKLGAKTLIDVDSADRFFSSLPAFGGD